MGERGGIKDERNTKLIEGDRLKIPYITTKAGAPCAAGK